MVTLHHITMTLNTEIEKMAGAEILGLSGEACGNKVTTKERKPADKYKKLYPNFTYKTC